MDILYACNDKMKRSYSLDVSFNKICNINSIVPKGNNILVSLKQINGLVCINYLIRYGR